MARRGKDMRIPCYEINAGHFPMITHPETIIDLLVNYKYPLMRLKQPGIPGCLL